MKNIVIILISFSFLAFLWGCETEVNVTQPTIFIGTDSPKVLDTLDISVTEYADIDGERVLADYFEWTILDDNERVVYSGFENNKDISWIPDSAGAFLVSVKIGYDGNKSITTLKEITVTESPVSLQKKLVGNWIGDAEHADGHTWKIDVTFTETGHYVAFAYDWTDLERYPSPFYFGYKLIDNPDGGEMCTTPSPDIPCQSFVIDEVIDNRGFGIFTVGLEYDIDAHPYWIECNNVFEIDRLSFSNGNNNVSFDLRLIGQEDTNEWYLRYNLIKVD